MDVSALQICLQFLTQKLKVQKFNLVHYQNISWKYEPMSCFCIKPSIQSYFRNVHVWRVNSLVCWLET